MRHQQAPPGPVHQQTAWLGHHHDHHHHPKTHHTTTIMIRSNKIVSSNSSNPLQPDLLRQQNSHKLPYVPIPANHHELSWPHLLKLHIPPASPNPSYDDHHTTTPRGSTETHAHHPATTPRSRVCPPQEQRTRPPLHQGATSRKSRPPGCQGCSCATCSSSRSTIKGPHR